MDPFSALIFALVVTHVIMRAAGQAGADQARAELGRARETILADLARRRTNAATRLWERLEVGRRVGPRAASWWAWAALRTASALRKAWRQRRRPAEQRRRGGRPTTGPIGRILGAAWRGGQYAWEDIRRQRGEGKRRRPDPVDTAVCERCGAVVAAAALAAGRTRHGTLARMCPTCRARCDEERQADAATGRGPAPSSGPGDVVDAELVDEHPAPGASERPAPPADDELERLRWLRDEIRARADAVRAAELSWDGRCGQTPALACVRCGSALAAFCCTNPACPLSWRNIPLPGPGDDDPPVPEKFALPVRYCPECRTQLVPRTWYAVNATNADVCLFCARKNHPEGACRPRDQLELAAIGEPVGDDGERLPVDARQHRMFGKEAARIATEAAAGEHGPCSLCGCPLDAARCCECCDGPASTRPCVTETARCGAAGCDDGLLPDGGKCPRCDGGGALELCLTHERPARMCPAPSDSPPDRPAGPQPPALEAAPTPDGGTQVSCEMHTQAGWAAAAESVQVRTAAIVDSAENMLRSLSAKNAGRGHIAAAKNWHDQVAAVTAQAGSIIAGVNDHQDPYVYAVQDAGGSAEVADPDFYDEM